MDITLNVIRQSKYVLISICHERRSAQASRSKVLLKHVEVENAVQQAQAVRDAPGVYQGVDRLGARRAGAAPGARALAARRAQFHPRLVSCSVNNWHIYCIGFGYLSERRYRHADGTTEG